MTCGMIIFSQRLLMVHNCENVYALQNGDLDFTAKIPLEMDQSSPRAAMNANVRQRKGLVH